MGAAARHGTRLLFASTSEVYGKNSRRAAREKGMAPYQTCQSPSVSGSTVNDTPSVQVKLFRWNGVKYKFVRTVFVGKVANGTKRLTIRTKTTGKHEVKTKADWKAWLRTSPRSSDRGRRAAHLTRIRGVGP
jgi:hypothetical protein